MIGVGSVSSHYVSTTDYTGFSTTPSISADPDTGGVNLGLEFWVTSSCTLAGIRFLQPSTGGNTNTRSVGLWDLVSSSFVVSSTRTVVSGDAGKWVIYTLPTPYNLVVNRKYRAIVLHPAGKYAATSGYFQSGGPGASNIINGPLVIPTSANATGGLQGSYLYASTLSNTNSSFNGANYYTDVIVSG